MNVIIVGGSGFIGTALMDIIPQPLQVINIDKLPSARHSERTQNGDITKKKDFAEVICSLDVSVNSYLVLLAAEHKDDVSPTSLYYDVNVEGTRNVLAAMDLKGINKIIFTSSVAVYGLNKISPDETATADPFNHYGKSKWEAEEVLREWHQKDPENRTLIIIRPTVVFGPENRGNVYNLLKQIATGKFLMIGKGKNKKSMAYVENVVGFIRYCVDKHFIGYHVINYVDKPDLDMNELIAASEASLGRKLPAVRIPYWIGYMGGLAFDVVGKVLGKKFPISAVRVKKFCATTQFADSGLKKSGYLSPYSLSEGLAKTIKSIISQSPN